MIQLNDSSESYKWIDFQREKKQINKVLDHRERHLQLPITLDREPRSLVVMRSGLNIKRYINRGWCRVRIPELQTLLTSRNPCWSILFQLWGFQLNLNALAFSNFVHWTIFKSLMELRPDYRIEYQEQFRSHLKFKLALLWFFSGLL